MSSTSAIRAHLHDEYTEPIRDPLWQNIYLSRELMRIVRERAFQKLGRIKQLGPAFQVYPGATHTRLNHSLGVFHLAKRIMLALLRDDSRLDLTVDGVKCFLCAALLHDLGHFPFAHSLKELPLKAHEALTAEMIMGPPLHAMIRGQLGVDPAFVAAIVDRSLPLVTNEREIGFFRRLLSGVLDPDKLDYLNRDAYFCGVPYGVQDTDFVISRMRPDATDGIAIEQQGLSAVENVLFSKYLMYRTVYWHKTVRIATAMIKKAVYLGMRDGVVEPRSLYGLDDDEFFARFAGLRFPPAVLFKRVAERNFLKSVHEEPYSPDNPLHARLVDLEVRSAHEELIARRLSRELGFVVAPESIIIDLPEEISFEVNLPIVGPAGKRPFVQSDSVFTAPVVEGFTRTLRKLRIIVPESVVGRISDPSALVGWA